MERDGAAPPRRPTVLIAGGGTGGHLMPALAIAEEIRRSHPEIEPVLVGAERGVESRILPTRDFRYHLLPAEPIYRRQWWKNLRWLRAGPRLLLAARRVLAQERPLVVAGTGGYAAGPVVWLAARRGIPSAIQEQNAYPGIVTRRLSGRVRQVYLGLPEARTRIRPGRATEVLDTGNPIVPPDPARRTTALAGYGIPPGAPVVVVTGGSQGSQAINQAVAGWLDAGGGDGVVLLWAAGRATYPLFARYHRPPAVQVCEFLDPIADAYAVADLIVGRAGAMTLAELCAWGLPGILIPLPSAAADHQTHNARALAEVGAAVLLPQSELSPVRLGTELGRLLADPGGRQAMAERARSRGHPDAARQIVSHLLTLR